MGGSRDLLLLCRSDLDSPVFIVFCWGSFLFSSQVSGVLTAICVQGSGGGGEIPSLIAALVAGGVRDSGLFNPSD